MLDANTIKEGIPQMVAEGKTDREIAEQLKISIHSVRYWLKRLRANGYELPDRPRGRRPIL